MVYIRQAANVRLLPYFAVIVFNTWLPTRPGHALYYAIMHAARRFGRDDRLVGISRAISGGIVMALRHFMATHQYLTKDARDASFDPENQSTDREFFEQFTTERAKVLQHWRGSDDFFFCHWFAESEDDIHKALEQGGAAGNVMTMASEMHRYVSVDNITDEQMVIPPMPEDD